MMVKKEEPGKVAHTNKNYGHDVDVGGGSCWERESDKPSNHEPLKIKLVQLTIRVNGSAL
eukprot:scaffold10570_cov176-Amphora_coffeaeformis.AAC.46